MTFHVCYPFFPSQSFPYSLLTPFLSLLLYPDAQMSEPLKHKSLPLLFIFLARAFKSFILGLSYWIFFFTWTEASLLLPQSQQGTTNKWINIDEHRQVVSYLDLLILDMSFYFYRVLHSLCVKWRKYDMPKQLQQIIGNIKQIIYRGKILINIEVLYKYKWLSVCLTCNSLS